MKAIRILLSIAMLIAAGLGAFNVIPLRTAYFTLIILVAITVSIRIIHLWTALSVSFAAAAQKTFRGWRRSQSAGRPSALQKPRSWRPIRGSSWQKENLRFIVWVSRDKNKNPAITRVFETYLGEPYGEKSHNQQFISDPLF